MIRSATPADAPQLAAIYNHYVLHTPASFEEQPVADADMARRIQAALKSGAWLVREQAGRIAGYACASPFNSRSAYRHSLETTVYVAPDALRHGHGLALYEALLPQLAKRHAHSAIAVIALPNPASVGLHERLGYRKAGELAEVGHKFGQWISIGYWQLLL